MFYRFIIVFICLSLTSCLSTMGHHYTFNDPPKVHEARSMYSDELNLLLASSQLHINDLPRFKRGMYEIDPYTMGDAITDGVKLADAAIMFTEGLGLLSIANLGDRRMSVLSRLHSNGFYLQSEGKTVAQIEERVFAFMEAYVDKFVQVDYLRKSSDLKRNKHATERYLALTPVVRAKGQKDFAGADYQRMFQFNGVAYAGVNNMSIGDMNLEKVRFLQQYTKTHQDVIFFVKYDINNKTGQCYRSGFLVEAGESRIIPELVCTDLVKRKL